MRRVIRIRWSYSPQLEGNGGSWPRRRADPRRRLSYGERFRRRRPPIAPGKVTEGFQTCRRHQSSTSPEPERDNRAKGRRLELSLFPVPHGNDAGAWLGMSRAQQRGINHPRQYMDYSSHCATDSASLARRP